MILPQTAASNNGLCGQCVRVPPEQRAAKREYERKLVDGSVFVPSDRERSTASIPHELTAGQWKPQPEYYADDKIGSAMEAIVAARPQSNGNVFLVTENGGQLNIGFTERYGVCEYQSQEAGEFRYANSESNLREQVPEELHVVQECPCCGVGMLWYPSRFHMPRERAFLILENAVAHRNTPGVEWLDCDDFSYTGRGGG
jgi:hypothetical protein